MRRYSVTIRLHKEPLSFSGNKALECFLYRLDEAPLLHEELFTTGFRNERLFILKILVLKTFWNLSIASNFRPQRCGIGSCLSLGSRRWLLFSLGCFVCHINIMNTINLFSVPLNLLSFTHVQQQVFFLDTQEFVARLLRIGTTEPLLVEEVRVFVLSN